MNILLYSKSKLYLEEEINSITYKFTSQILNKRN